MPAVSTVPVPVVTHSRRGRLSRQTQTHTLTKKHSPIERHKILNGSRARSQEHVTLSRGEQKGSRTRGALHAKNNMKERAPSGSTSSDVNCRACAAGLCKKKRLYTRKRERVRRPSNKLCRIILCVCVYSSGIYDIDTHIRCRTAREKKVVCRTTRTVYYV